MSYEDLVVFENELNDDIPIEYIDNIYTKKQEQQRYMTNREILLAINDNNGLYEGYKDDTSDISDTDEWSTLRLNTAKNGYVGKLPDISDWCIDYTKTNKSNQSNQYYNNKVDLNDYKTPTHKPSEHNVRSLYDYTEVDNMYDVNSDKIHRFNKTPYDIKSRESDFKICEELFKTNKKEEIFNDLMKIYENPNENKAEFTEIKFHLGSIPIALLRFNHITELVVKKCAITELNVLPPKIKKIVFNNCGLKIISCLQFPNTLTHIDFCNNEIELITDIKKTITHLYLDNNNLQYIHDIPENSELKVLSLKNNKIKRIDFLIDVNLIELHLNNNSIDNIDVLSNTIEILDISKNNIFTIAVLPENLKILFAYNCKINKFLFELPYFLEKLDLYNNNIEELPEFNKFLKWLDISSNDIRKLPNNVAQLDYCDISSNLNLIFDSVDPNWIIFMESKNKTYIMDKQDDYILKSDTVSSISSSETDSDDSGETVDSKDSSDIENFKLKIKNNANNTDSDKLDEEFKSNKDNLYEPSWSQLVNSIQHKTEDPIVSSILDNMRNNNTLKNSVTNIIDSFKPKEKRIVKTLKTFTM
jgi:hypothetical protein